MGLIENIRRVDDVLGSRLSGLLPAASQRSDPLPLSLQDYINLFSYSGNLYPFGLNTTYESDREEISANFEGLTVGAFKANAVVHACMLARQMLFSEARFQFRERRKGRPGDLFGKTELAVLENPWPGATTGDLLSRAIQDADLAGTAFLVRNRQDRITRLRPNWVTMVLAGEGESELNADLLGLIYHPGGRSSGEEPIIIDASNVAIFAPTPDPFSKYRGVSWLMSLVPEIESDTAATRHKVKFFDHGATVNLVIQTGEADRQKFLDWVRKFREGHEGAANANKTLFLTPGADAKAIGADFQQMDFKAVQGAGETRIAAAAGVPPVIVGLSEGLAAATYSNYSQARRRFADLTMRPLWRNMAGSLARIIAAPEGAELWYDDRDIPFLAEDVKDAAEVQKQQASTINQLITAGYQPDAVIEAVTAGDFERLRGKHSGLYSVQLQPPMPETPEPESTLLLPNGQNGAAKPAVPEA